MSDKMYDYHVHVLLRDIRVPAGADVRAYVFDIWRVGFDTLGIPLIPHLTRCVTRDNQPDGVDIYEIIYGLAAPSTPDSQAFLESMIESLEIHQQGQAGALVQIFRVRRTQESIVHIRWKSSATISDHKEVLSA